MLTPEESFPSFSVGYRDAQSVFYEQFNDVDFFVEDEEQENFYYSILNKLFPGVQIEKITPLRGKPHVIQHAKNNHAKRKSVYIVDKDFDDLLGKIYKQPNLFYLDKYSIENFLLEEGAIIKFIMDEKPRLKSAKVKVDLQFQSSVDTITKQLAKPFALFYIAKRNEVHALKNTSHKPDCFCLAKDKSCVDESMVSGYAKQLKRTAAGQGLNIDLNKELEGCSTVFEMDCQSNLQGKHISGEFILCLLAHKIVKSFEFGYIPDLKSLAFRLAQECEFHSLKTLQKRVNEYLKS